MVLFNELWYVEAVEVSELAFKKEKRFNFLLYLSYLALRIM